MWEARNLSFWHEMRVGGKTARRARLVNGDVVRLGAIEVTFADELE